MNRNGIEAANDTGPAVSASAEYDHVGRRLRTLEHCALHKRALRLTYMRCGHVRVLDAVCMWWMFNRRGWDDSLPAAASRLCCAACKQQAPPLHPAFSVSPPSACDGLPHFSTRILRHSETGVPGVGR